MHACALVSGANHDRLTTHQFPFDVIWWLLAPIVCPLAMGRQLFAQRCPTSNGVFRDTRTRHTRLLRIVPFATSQPGSVSSVGA